MRRLLVLAGLPALIVLLAALPASACSCFRGDPRDQFAQADAAIVGEYVGARPTDDPDDYEAIYTFTVREEWKTDFGDTLEVYSAENGAMCGLEAAPGQEVGLFLTMMGDRWHSNLCSQTSPKTMREAASPLPEPNGSGAPRLVLGGSFGSARVMSLDDRQRTLAYGYGGDHDATLLDACPGGKRFVEVWHDYRDSGGRGFAVRRVSDLTIVDRMKLSVTSEFDIGGLDCRDPRGEHTFLMTARYFGDPRGAIYDITDGRMRTLFDDLQATRAEFGDDHAFLSGRHRLIQLDIRNGDSRTLLSLAKDRNTGRAALSPGQTHVAVVVEGSYEPQRGTRLALVRLGDLKVHKRSLADNVSTVWLEWAGARRVVALSSAQRGSGVFDLQLDVVNELSPWYGPDFVVHRGSIWAAADGILWKMDLSGGEAREQRELPSPINNALIEIPKATRD